MCLDPVAKLCFAEHKCISNLCADNMNTQVEAELRELDPVEAAEYLQSLGASEGGLASLIRSAYRQLGLLTYFTTGRPPISHTLRWKRLIIILNRMLPADYIRQTALALCLEAEKSSKMHLQVSRKRVPGQCGMA